jgi:hypothetical protein
MKNQPRFAEFEVLQEPWSKYRLSDGTILKSRFELLKVINFTGPDGKEGASIANQIVNVIESPVELMGEPGGPKTVPELQKCIIQPKLRVDPLVQKPSAYLISGERLLLVRTAVTEVSRTTLYDSEGSPHYLITATALLAAALAPHEIPSGVQGLGFGGLATDSQQKARDPLPSSPRRKPKRSVER